MENKNFLSGTTFEPGGPISVDEFFRFPLPGMAIPNSFAFRPDNRQITFLSSPEASLTNRLYAYDPQTGDQSLLLSPPTEMTENNLSHEEVLRRQRQRQRSLGITQYHWAAHINRLLIPFQGDLYIKDELEGPLQKRIAGGDRPLIDPKFSPDGQWIAYVQDAELYVVPFSDGASRQLTFGARGTGRTHGLAEYAAQEEMERSTGYWWSPDSQRIAFTEVDETHIPLYRIVHQGKDETGESFQEDHHYPFAGKANARLKLGVVSIQGGEPVWMDLGENQDIYLARVNWLPGGDLTAQVLNREQTRLELLRFDAHTGARSLILQETSEYWINLHNLFYPLHKTSQEFEGGFIWASERTGFRHLYLYNRNGELVRALTQGEWQVESIAGVDESRGRIYFTGTKESPLENHLYCVNYSGEDLRRLTQEPGMHSLTLDRECKSFIDTYSTVDHPPILALRSLEDGSLQRIIYDQMDPRITALGLTPPEMVSLENRDGIRLYGAVYRPDKSFGEGPYPSLIQVYGGPHAQSVDNSWKMTASMRAQYLRSLGFLVFVLDNRGSARRGLAFESGVHHHLGSMEVQDQIDGVNWLIQRKLADPDRIGVYGWSYGGYMAAMCLAQAPDLFKAAVSGAPVTHWDGYDTCYTERYMGTPQSNPDGYLTSSVMHHISTLKGKLLLVHGLIDENVHFRHTARLINALIQSHKAYELLIFPDERHMPRKDADRDYMEERIRDFFLANLS